MTHPQTSSQPYLLQSGAMDNCYFSGSTRDYEYNLGLTISVLISACFCYFHLDVEKTMSSGGKEAGR
jgi:hypothetical protein